MRAYTIVASLLFLAILLGHVARIAAEGWSVLAQPVFAASTAIGIVMVGWGAMLLRRNR